MTVKELKEILNQYDENENVYVWKGNFPYEHYGTDIEIGKNIYGSITDENDEIIENPLIII